LQIKVSIHGKQISERLVSLHEWLGRHVADSQASRWDRGNFVSTCTVCDRAMIKLPGLAWQLRPAVG